MKLMVLSLAWVAGVFAGSEAEIAVWPFWAALPLGAAILWRRNPRAVLALAALALVCLGAWRFDAHHEAVVARDDLGRWRETGRLALRGTVVSQPDIEDMTARWRVDVREARPPSSPQWSAAQGQVLVYHRWLADVRYGDELQLEGRLETPPKFDRFDYQGYLARQGIHSVMRYPHFSVQGRGHGNPFLSALYSARERFAQAISRALPEPQAAIASGILLGIRSGIPEEIVQQFRLTGTSHILAVSGHNLTVVAGLIAVLSGRLLGRRHWTYLGIILMATWGYALLAGFVPSAIRAAIMASLVFTARAAGRQDHAIPALALAAAVMTAFDPLVLWDVGFQLSATAMAGIVLVPPLVDQAAERIWGWRLSTGPWRLPASATSATLGATFFTLPVLAVNFQTVPFGALPANLFALPMLPPILLGAFATAVCGVLFPAVATIPAAVTWVASSCLLAIVEWWTNAPFASIPRPPVDPLLGSAYLALLPIGVWLVRQWLAGLPAGRRPAPRPVWLKRLVHPGSAHGFSLTVLATLALGATWAASTRLPPEAVVVRFLDIGQGDAVLVETGSGHRMLIDGGPSPSRVLGHLGRWVPAWDPSLDLVVLTHPQRDHLTGLVAVIDRYSVALALETEETSDSMEYREWERLLAERGVQRARVGAGTRVRLGPAEVVVLHPRTPPERGSGWEPNDASLVLRLAAHGTRVLLTGDVEAYGEEALLRASDLLASHVLKVPHHGSKSSSSPALLSAVTPQAAIISVGAGNSFGHPAPAVLDRLGTAPVLRTDLDGTIELTISREKAVLRGGKPRPES